MKFLRRQLQACTWFALVAMLALALAPTVSRALALAQGGGSAWAEVCTPQGMVRVALDDAPRGTPAPAHAGGMLDHCPFCGLAGQAAGMPPAPPVLPPVQAEQSLVPPLWLQAPHTLFAWRSAQPRGPPQVC
ncbi:MAG: DUF2946 domain-containing protein [Rubrivivax sp.]|nr:DUF2946 domain-containing protein [Rubrivivax sp.]